MSLISAIITSTFIDLRNKVLFKYSDRIYSYILFAYSSLNNFVCVRLHLIVAIVLWSKLMSKYQVQLSVPTSNFKFHAIVIKVFENNTMLFNAKALALTG